MRNYKELLKEDRSPSHMRLGSIAILKVFLETLRHRTKRRHFLNPWDLRDMFRLNQRRHRVVVLNCENDPSFEQLFVVEYLDEHKFNCYLKDDKKGWLVPVLLDAEIDMNPYKDNEVFIRTDSEEYTVDFFIDKHGEVTTLDYENAPMPYVRLTFIFNGFTFLFSWSSAADSTREMAKTLQVPRLQAGCQAMSKRS